MFQPYICTILLLFGLKCRDASFHYLSSGPAAIEATVVVDEKFPVPSEAFCVAPKFTPTAPPLYGDEYIVAALGNVLKWDDIQFTVRWSSGNTINKDSLEGG
ncbi:uncharacterized protein BO87DRAFT_3646 [Aspergillus neoniger CBS 115656]|uniref:Plastocyanin-like domain-containing protein n=1 Tax=Aspergillus neoniger (strain CBS 115656) TaxID=1448310 RepID=A0A318Z7G3_ASPNB|nr:hypothetical protein BO87DRAFT_3646 [Aspergillus neoniger CBS 115656]PYH39620.1 hypothetical protein BO87DRAFT_3646 [Aspergillus neoniger CBS 115656]